MRKQELRKIYKQKLLRLVGQYRLTNQVKFVDNCKNIYTSYPNFVETMNSLGLPINEQ